jgi:hypothetical protein
MRTWNLLLFSIFLSVVLFTVSGLAQTQATPATQSKQQTKQGADKEKPKTEQNAKGTTTGTRQAAGTADKTKQSAEKSTGKHTTTGVAKSATTAGAAKTTTAGGARTGANSRGTASAGATASDTNKGHQPPGKPRPTGSEKPGADGSTPGAVPHPPRPD